MRTPKAEAKQYKRTASWERCTRRRFHVAHTSVGTIAKYQEIEENTKMRMPKAGRGNTVQENCVVGTMHTATIKPKPYRYKRKRQNCACQRQRQFSTREKKTTRTKHTATIKKKMANKRRHHTLVPRDRKRGYRRPVPRSAQLTRRVQA